MKTAIIILPSLNNNVYLPGYLTLCASKVESAGYILLHNTNWDSYKRIDFTEFFKRLNPKIDSYFLFVDFGVTNLMVNLIHRFYQEGIFKKEINIEVARDYDNLSLTGILKIVSDKTKISIESITGRNRKREIVEARQFYCKYARGHTKHSLQQIGNIINKDHATVLHGIRTVNNVRELLVEYCQLFGFKLSEKSIDNPVIDTPLKAEIRAMIQPEPPEEKYVNPFSNHSKRSEAFSGYRVHSF
jgi:hypothetical protein